MLISAIPKTLIQEIVTRRQEVFLFGVSILVRIASWLFYGSWLAGDSPDYIDLARNLAFNNAFAFSGNNGELIYTAFRPVLYPAFIALLWTDVEPPISAIVLIQILLAGITVVMLYSLAHRYFTRRIAFLSALLFALSPMAIRYTLTMMSETLFTFLLVGACYFWSRRQPIVSGISFGFSLLARPILFPLLLILPAFSLLPRFRQFRRDLVIIAAVSITLTVPWMIRNSSLTGQFTLTQSSGFGTNLLFGTIETPLFGDDVWSWITKLPLTQNVDGLNEIEQDRRKFRVALERIRNNPIQWVKVRAKQYPRLFLDSNDWLLGTRNRSINQAFTDGDVMVLLLKIGSIVASLLIVISFMVGVSWQIYWSPESLCIYCLPLFFMLIHLPMWIESRYLLPVMPFIYILSVNGLAVSVNLLRRTDIFRNFAPA